jgi:hypothetical protein
VGTDPNFCESSQAGRTTWECVLWKIRNGDEESRKNPVQAADIIQLFIEHVADVAVIVDGLTVEIFINDRLRHWNAARTDQILSKVRALQKKGNRPGDQGQKLVEPPFGVPLRKARTDPTIVVEAWPLRSARGARDRSNFWKSLNMSSSSKDVSAKPKSRGLGRVFTRSKDED